MPFTFSHPAIVLPFTLLPKKWYSITGLVIGSLMPDFEYFLRLKVRSDFSHTILGIFYFDLPLGILISFVFCNLVRNSLYFNLPTFLQSRFLIFTQFDWNNHFKKYWLVVLISIIAGAFSHVFWDAFTHADGYFVSRIAFLNEELMFLGFHIPIFKLLQHLSTLLGSLVLVFVIFRLPIASKVQNFKKRKYWLVLSFLSLFFLTIRFIVGLNLFAYGQVLVTIISAALISLILTPMVLKKHLVKK
jgi:hypothetical protein